MNRFRRIVVTSMALGVVVTFLPHVIAQRRFYARPRPPLDVMRRIESLERRVSVLERMAGKQAIAQARAPAPSTDAIDIETAEQRVDAAEQRLSYTQRLYEKGYVSQAAWEEDHYELTRAQKVLQMARAREDGKPTRAIESEIEILDAERFLAVAKRESQLAERYANRGLAGSNVEAHRKVVEDAEKRLEEAKANAP